MPGGTENSAATRVRRTATLNSEGSEAEASTLEGKKKSAHAMLDGMMPLISNNKVNDDDEDGGKPGKGKQRQPRNGHRPGTPADPEA